MANVVCIAPYGRHDCSGHGYNSADGANCLLYGVFAPSTLANAGRGPEAATPNP